MLINFGIARALVTCLHELKVYYNVDLYCILAWMTSHRV